MNFNSLIFYLVQKIDFIYNYNRVIVFYFVFISYLLLLIEIKRNIQNNNLLPFFVSLF